MASVHRLQGADPACCEELQHLLLLLLAALAGSQQAGSWRVQVLQ